MRTLIAAVAAASLLVSSAFAATDSVGPLAPGKPAGVKKAQLEDTTLLWVLGAGLVIGGIVLVATQDNGSSAPTSGGGSSTSSSTP
jgi:hypothetical protein